MQTCFITVNWIKYQGLKIFRILQLHQKWRKHREPWKVEILWKNHKWPTEKGSWLKTVLKNETVVPVRVQTQILISLIPCTCRKIVPGASWEGGSPLLFCMGCGCMNGNPPQTENSCLNLVVRAFGCLCNNSPFRSNLLCVRKKLLWLRIGMTFWSVYEIQLR